MRLGRYRFSPPWWGVALTAVGVVIFCLLGNWQIQRAQHKKDLIAAQETARSAGVQSMTLTPSDVGDGTDDGLEHGYRYTVQGQYDPAHQILLADQVEGTKTGYRVWTPLVLSSGVRVMVDRGWIPRDEATGDTALPDPAAPTESVTVKGFWRSFPQPGLRIGGDPACDKREWPRVLSYPAVATVRCQYGAPVANGLLLLDPSAPHGFDRDWETDDIGLSPFAHYAYASQWFLMALVVVVIFGLVNLKRRGR